MTDLATDAPTTDSTVLNPDASPTPGSGGGTPNLRDAMRDTVADAVAKASEAADKAEPADQPKEEKAADAPDKGDDKAKSEEKAPDPKKAEPTEKPEAEKRERGDDGKFKGSAPKAEPRTEEPSKPESDIQAPQRFMPDAREKWTNTPRAVQRDVEHAFREHEAQLTRYREGAERYETIRRYDEAVRQSGRAGIHETLEEVAQLEDLMRVNPVAAMNQILQRAGPRKADGSAYNLFEMAQSVVSAGQDNYNRTVANVRQEPREDPRVAQLAQQNAQLQAQFLAASVIEPFKRDHPRYDELSGHIVSFLKSGMVPDSLSAPERLAVAYDMAERLYPPSGQYPAPDASPDDDRRADEPSAATSIRTAPGAVTSVEEPKRGGTARDEVERVMRRLAQSGR